MKILITDSLSSEGKQVIESAGAEIVEILDGDQEKLNAVLPDVHGWIIRSGTRIDAASLQKAKSLKAIGRAGVGVDNIDIPAATERGIVVMNTPGGNTISAAEHSIALLMSLARNIPQGDASTKAGAWERKALTGTELNGKTLGLIGLGRIGQEVGRRALGLQMEVIGYDPYVSQDQLQVKDITVTPLEEVIAQADVISLHLPRTKETVDIIAKDELKRMKSSALLVNCARGGLVNEADLAAALESGEIAGAAIDVFSAEPPTDNPLLTAPNCVLTPHLGASTREAGINVAVQVAEQVVAYLKYGKLSHALNLPIADMGILKEMAKQVELARKIGSLQHPLHPGAVTELTLSYNGDASHITPLLYSAFEGLMENRYDDPINLINAKAVADSRGIALRSIHDAGLSSVSNVVSVQVTSDGAPSWTLMGYTDLQGGQRLIRVNDFRVDALLDGPLLMIMNQDVPGVVGDVGTLLGKAGINIAEYSLSRGDGPTALSLIKLDSEPEAGLLESLTGLPSILAAYLLN